MAKKDKEEEKKNQEELKPQSFRGPMHTIGVIIVVALAIIVFLRLSASEKTDGGNAKPEEPRIQWHLYWKKEAGMRGGPPQDSLSFPITIERRDAVLLVMWKMNGRNGRLLGDVQPDGSYRGTWKCHDGYTGEFFNLRFNPVTDAAEGIITDDRWPEKEFVFRLIPTKIKKKGP